MLGALALDWAMEFAPASGWASVTALAAEKAAEVVVGVSEKAEV